MWKNNPVRLHLRPVPINLRGLLLETSAVLSIPYTSAHASAHKQWGVAKPTVDHDAFKLKVTSDYTNATAVVEEFSTGARLPMTLPPNWLKELCLEQKSVWSKVILTDTALQAQPDFTFRRKSRPVKSAKPTLRRNKRSKLLNLDQLFFKLDAFFSL